MHSKNISKIDIKITDLEIPKKERKWYSNFTWSPNWASFLRILLRSPTPTDISGICNLHSPAASFLAETTTSSRTFRRHSRRGGDLSFSSSFFLPPWWIFQPSSGVSGRLRLPEFEAPVRFKRVGFRVARSGVDLRVLVLGLWYWRSESGEGFRVLEEKFAANVAGSCGLPVIFIFES